MEICVFLALAYQAIGEKGGGVRTAAGELASSFQIDAKKEVCASLHHEGRWLQ